MKIKYVTKVLRIAWAIGEKDIRIYYLRPGSLIFGILFPLSMFLSYIVGRNVSIAQAIPILVAQTLFFASSSIGPITIPLERRLRTFDRYLSAPISLKTVLLGKTISGFLYGLTVSSIPIIAGVVFFQSTITNIIALIAGMILSAFCFAAMGLMFASIPGQNPGQVMMPMNFVRIPLLFISGVFIPISELPSWGQFLSGFSPLTHTIELVKGGLGGENIFGPFLNITGLVLYLAVFLLVGIRFHIINQKKE
ncbi:MAG: ABC transporter permease [Candidatus Bathyarchaeota archaeon]|nr:ABC transporter permease [Candidatus Bathyarchaeum tardum]WGM88832.1 MAG: ABC transporter permease [Candidatus Bathyarchaeum tardum]